MNFDLENTRREMIVIPEETPQFNLTLEIARRYFIGQRVLDGAHTEIGHRWSNMVEFFQNYARSEDPEQRMNLLTSIIRTVLEIRAMRRGLPMPELSRPQILLAFSNAA